MRGDGGAAVVAGAVVADAVGVGVWLTGVSVGVEVGVEVAFTVEPTSVPSLQPAATASTLRAVPIANSEPRNRTPG